MKKLLCILLIAIILFGLAACCKSPITSQSVINQNQSDPAPDTSPIEDDEIKLEAFDAPAEKATEPNQLLSYSIYVPNHNADGFDLETIRTEEISSKTVLNELKKRSVLPDTVSIHHFNIDNGLITLDFNQAFADVVCSMGTSGELMIIGSVVNTFLDAFQAEYVYFTVDGQILESGHTIYDFVIPSFSVDPQSLN